MQLWPHQFLSPTTFAVLHEAPGSWHLGLQGLRQDCGRRSIRFDVGAMRLLVALFDGTYNDALSNSGIACDPFCFAELHLP
jgi:hypothetical protein